MKAFVQWIFVGVIFMFAFLLIVGVPEDGFKFYDLFIKAFGFFLGWIGYKLSIFWNVDNINDVINEEA